MIASFGWIDNLGGALQAACAGHLVLSGVFITSVQYRYGPLLKPNAAQDTRAVGSVIELQRKL